MKFMGDAQETIGFEMRYLVVPIRMAVQDLEYVSVVPEPKCLCHSTKPYMFDKMKLVTNLIRKWRMT